MSNDAFLNSIVQTSSATVIDIDAMFDTYSRVADSIDTLTQARTTCTRAANAADAIAGYAPAHAMIGPRLEALEEWIGTSAAALEALCTNLASSMLIYLSAEQRSAEFFALRAVVDPSAETLMRRAEEVLNDMRLPRMLGIWGTGHFTGTQPFGGVSLRLPGRLLVRRDTNSPSGMNLYANTWRESALSFFPFIVSRGGSASSLPAQALHIERHSDELMSELSVLPWQSQNARAGMGPHTQFRWRHAGGSWWNSKGKPQTPWAAGVAVASARGWMRGSGKAPAGIAALGYIEGPDGNIRTIDALLPAHREGRYIATPTASSSAVALLLTHGTRVPPDAHPLWTAQGAPSSDVLRRAIEADKARIPQRDEYSSHVHTPLRPSELVERISGLDSSPTYGQFEILRHDTPNAMGGTDRSWSVVIRGTQVWDVGSPNAQDMDTNLAGVNGDESDQTRIIREVMAQAGIGTNEPVEFVGHSQGGLVAMQLASDASITDHYQVAAVLTAGAPTGHYVPTTSAGTLNVENLRDLVPALDGTVANADQGNATTVYFDGAQLLADPTGERPFDHDIGVYTDALARMENVDDVRTRGVQQWAEARTQALHLNEDTHTTRFVINTARVGYTP